MATISAFTSPASEPCGIRWSDPMSILESSSAEIDQAVRTAAAASASFRELSVERRATFLDNIAAEIENLGDPLIECASSETALPVARITGERARTTNELRMLAAVVREGSWCDARIDRAQPDRKPAAKPDLRRMLIPVGPVGVWAASNFP